ncbi:MAG: hypothetical protein ACJZ46_01255 [Candidatus Thalassarchaeaceae archaeon]
MNKQVLVVVMLLSCFVAGCMEADVEDSEFGCTYPEATNHNATAAMDDGSCIYPESPVPILGCMYSDALNHNPLATEDDGSCRYPVVADPVPGCTYPDAYNYDMNATEDDGSCVYDRDGDGIVDGSEESGCTDANANNYNASSTDDDGSCDYDEDDDGVYDWAESEGCTDAGATNFDASATESNQTMCEYPYLMSEEDLQTFLDEGSIEVTIANLGNVTSFIRVINVEESAEEEGMDNEGNANTTAMEIIMGHDPINEILYQSLVLRFMGDISMEQTTVQGPDGINYRIGNSDSGSWYYARDEVYQYENPFQDDEEDDGGDISDDDDEDEENTVCDDFFDDATSNWSDNWTISHDNGVNTFEGINEELGLYASLELVGNPPLLSNLEISQINGMTRCSIEILDSSMFDISIDTDLPKTSMTMKIENEAEEETDSTKTWSADLSEEHFEEVNLTEIEIRVIYNEGDEDGEEVTHIVDSMKLSEQTSTYTDQCFQWTLSWSDNDNDGYTSAGDAYTVTRAEKIINPCSDDDEYRDKEFQVEFYDLWADMPTGGVFTPGFGFFATISALLASSMFIGRRD